MINNISRSMNSKIVDVAYLIILAVAAAIIIRTLHLIYDLMRPMPYWDCWEFMKSIPVILDGQYTLHDLLAFHNEHRIVTTRLVMLADIALFAGTGYLSTALLTAVLCVMGCLLSFSTAKRTWRAGCIAALTVSLLLSVAQSDNYSSGFQIAFPLADLFSVVSIGLFVLSSTAQRSSWLFLVGAVIADFLAIGTLASGNIVVISILLSAIALRIATWKVVAFTIPAVAVSAFYFIGYPVPEVAHSYNVIGVAHFTLNYLGCSFRGYPGASLYLGSALASLYLIFLANMAFAWSRKERLDPVMVWLTAIGAFVITGGVITATGRLSLGMEASIVSRYALQSLLFVCCLFLLAWRFSESVLKTFAPRLTLMIVCLAISAASTLSAQPMVEWRQRISNYDIAGTAFANGVFSNDATKGVYPFPGAIRQLLSYMAAHQIGPFSVLYATAYRPPVNGIASADFALLPPCIAASDLLSQTGPGWYEQNGWVVNQQHPAENGWVLAFDANMRLLGFARASVNRPDVANSLHLALPHVGYHLALNTNGDDPVALKEVHMVLLPEGIGEAACITSLNVDRLN